MTPVICGLCHRPIVKGQYITYAHAETTRLGSIAFLLLIAGLAVVVR